DFGDGLRSILRQDPDVVMIGEIRDLDTASTAAQAALTGHVLLSTLHTNSAIEAVPRLVNMGLPEFIIAPSLHTIIAQRLARRVCKDCAVKKPLTDANKEIISKTLADIVSVRPDLKQEMPTELITAVGCEKCSKTGYSGRVVIAEFISIDDEIKGAVLNKMPAFKILELCRKKGFITMQEDGVLKVLDGITTLDEVYRVTNV
ncbi:Flp pilus assembly complex ATPase component TadA, partial [Candidatus Peregrinibacteria bacterium]|nr:Flp pilus assembly complex ATPase component TadA [Candidatus Peregrinibacteria bacterium]